MIWSGRKADSKVTTAKLGTWAGSAPASDSTELEAVNAQTAGIIWEDAAPRGSPVTKPQDTAGTAAIGPWSGAPAAVPVQDA